MKGESKNLNPGMDEAQRRKDSGGFTTTVQNITGGTGADLGAGSGIEVGNAGSDLGEGPIGKGTYSGGSSKADPKSGT